MLCAQVWLANYESTFNMKADEVEEKEKQIKEKTTHTQLQLKV